mmetsp:Transcript_1906/g.5699  ORF Transcript_1906/g.5699 Transcript_1906/m.5699 type:complete len:359 (+) Transcript_1906:253-1329(+)
MPHSLPRASLHSSSLALLALPSPALLLHSRGRDPAPARARVVRLLLQQRRVVLGDGVALQPLVLVLHASVRVLAARHRAPALLEVVRAPGHRAEEGDHQIERVHGDPVVAVAVLHRKAAAFLESTRAARFDHHVRHALHVRPRVAGGEDHVLAQRGVAPEVDRLHVHAALGLDRSHHLLHGQRLVAHDRDVLRERGTGRRLPVLRESAARAAAAGEVELGLRRSKCARHSVESLGCLGRAGEGALLDADAVHCGVHVEAAVFALNHAPERARGQRAGRRLRPFALRVRSRLVVDELVTAVHLIVVAALAALAAPAALTPRGPLRTVHVLVLILCTQSRRPLAGHCGGRCCCRGGCCRV